MTRIGLLTFHALIAFALFTGITGCDALGEVFDREKELSGVVEEVGSDFLVIDGVTYHVNGDTEYEGIDSLEELSVGDEVDVVYEGGGSERTALEVEFGENEDDDGGLFG